MPKTVPTTAMTPALNLAMAVAAGVAVANIYYVQPMLGLIEQEMPGAVAGLMPTVTQLGYAAGLFLLVPLGDLLERKALILVQFALLAVALAAVAIAPGPLLLIAGSLLVGLMATVAQQVVPLAAHLAAAPERGAVVGKVMAGLLCGILLSRTVSGFVGAHFGWREMYWLGVPVALVVGLWMAVVLPRSRPEGGVGYGALLRSLGSLWREFGALRLAALTQALMFAAFSLFWTILAFRLQARFGLGAEIAGLFGIAGAVGVLGAPIAGRIADRQGPGRTILFGVGLALFAWLLFGVWTSVAGLVAGVVLLDFAVQVTLVSNQYIVFSLRPEARARLNTLFLGIMFLGGAAGSALSVHAYARFGWAGVVMAGCALVAAAAALQMRQWRRGGRMRG